MATLSQLLANQTLGLRLLQSAPHDPELTWVSTTELLDLGDYLEGGELVLTTGVSLEERDPRWRDFVAGLSRARIAGIGFGVGVAHVRVPQLLIAAASEYRVALVEVPPPTPFIAVSKATSHLLRADEMRAAKQALLAHQQLIEGARNSTDPAAVLASIAQATGRQLAVQIGTAVSPMTTSVSAGASAPSMGIPSFAQTLSASTAGFHAATSLHAAQTEPPLPLESIPLDAENNARLLVAPGPPLTPEAQAVITAGAMVLGIHARTDLTDQAQERDRWSRLTQALLADEVDWAAVLVLDQTLKPETEYRALALHGASERVAAWRRAPRYGADRLVSAGSPRADGISLAWQLCAADEASLARATAVATSYGLDVVAGRPAQAGALALSRNSAAALTRGLSRQAALYASPRRPQVIRAEEASPLLDALLATQHAASLSREVLGALSDAPSAELPRDERNKLRRTLVTLLEHNGQKNPAAAALGIHRNTLRDRLTRIEALTGKSLESPDARAELWLALRLES